MGTWDRWKKNDDDDPYVKFGSPGDSVEGVITRISSTDFGGTKPLIPVLHLKTRQGTEKILNVQQTVLLSRMAELAPDVGDHVLVTYTGDAKNAMPGRNPAKLFDVVVTPKALQAEAAVPAAPPPPAPVGQDDSEDEPF